MVICQCRIHESFLLHLAVHRAQSDDFETAALLMFGSRKSGTENSSESQLLRESSLGKMIHVVMPPGQWLKP